MRAEDGPRPPHPTPAVPSVSLLTHTKFATPKNTQNQPREWPYEHIVPGIPRNAEPYNGGRQVGHRRREREREERRARIADAMARMPSLIAAYRAARRVPWEEVTPVDRLLMTARQIREKYVLRKLK